MVKEQALATARAWNKRLPSEYPRFRVFFDPDRGEYVVKGSFRSLCYIYPHLYLEKKDSRYWTEGSLRYYRAFSIIEAW